MKSTSKNSGVGKRILKAWEHPVHFKAVAIHRNHRREPLSIPKGSFLEALYMDESPVKAIMKSTQCGVSEYLICYIFHRVTMRRNGLYILPTMDLRGQYIKERVDKTIMFTPYYTNLFRTKEFSESIALKQTPFGTIAFVGSNTVSSFISWRADDVVVDELDSCNQENLAMVPERQSASPDPTTIRVGNPTIVGAGIDYEYSKSDRKKWNIKHSCGKYINPDFFQHVVREVDKGVYVMRDKEWKRGMNRDINPICHHCNKPYDRHQSGMWIPSEKSDISGYHISKMFSTQVKLVEMVNRFNEGLTNDTVMQRFYNGDLGLGYTAPGAQITTEMLDACIDGYTMPNASAEPCYMGIDVGTWMHVVVREYNTGRAVYINQVLDPKDIEEIYRRYNVKMACIDALPETRMSKKLCARLRMMWMVFYGGEKKESLDLRMKIITAPRTMTLDTVREDVITGTSKLPMNAKTILDYYSHMTASTRVYDEESNKYNWIAGSKADHYFHAEAYASLAKKLIRMATR